MKRPPKTETSGHPEKASRPKVRIESDETGHIKGVFYGDKVLPVTEFTLTAHAKEPLAVAELTMWIEEIHITAVVGQIAMICPVCSDEFHHQCHDNPAEQDEDDFH